MGIDIRLIRDDELVPWLDSLSIGFLDRPDLARVADEVRPHWDFSRIWGAFDDALVAGTTRTWPTEITVPGDDQVKASAVAAVTVRPTHRRRGILRRMLAAEHAAARERGEVVSILYASEYPIYGRFGYGPAAPTTAWRVDVAATGIAEAVGGRSGSIEFMAPDDAAVDVIRTIFEGWRVRQPGEIWRRPVMWQSDLGLAGQAWGEAWKGFLVVHRNDAGTPDGYARYHVESKWERRQPASTLIVDDMHALDDEAAAALWRFIAGVDLVTTVRVERRHPADRLPWLLTNARAAEPIDHGDGLWLKLLDIPRALEARRWERSGSLVIEALVRDGADATAPAERVRVLLDASPEGARATTTDRAPDLTLDESALGSAYLGGVRLRDAVLARGVDEHRPGALADADGLFATLDPPWCSTFF